MQRMTNLEHAKNGETGSNKEWQKWNRRRMAQFEYATNDVNGGVVCRNTGDKSATGRWTRRINGRVAVKK